MKRLLILNVALCCLATALATAAAAQGAAENRLRGATPLSAEAAAASTPKPVNDDIRRARAYAMQPPLIPHQIDNYQIDASFNKCMSCHARDKVQESQAIMISVTHFADRDGHFRAELSPRRYYCTQCHVVQYDVKPPVANTFGARPTGQSAPASVPSKQARPSGTAP
jgi:nitrate reductase (cytochrome), electron transfer subunit